MNALIHARRTTAADGTAADGSDSTGLRCDKMGRLLMGGEPVYFEFTDGGAGAYIAKDSVGAKQTLTNIARQAGATVIIDTIFVVDDAGVTPDLTLLFFQSGNPTAADNAPFAWAAAHANVTGKLRITAADWELPAGAGQPGIATLTALNMCVKTVSSSSDLIVALVTNAAYVLGSGSKVRIYLGVRQ